MRVTLRDIFPHFYNTFNGWFPSITSGQLVHHMRENHRYCDSCSTWLPDTAAWDSHQLLSHGSSHMPAGHSGVGPVYQSLEVRDAVRSIMATPTHAAVELPQQQELYSCGLCTKSFSSRGVMRLHMASSHATLSAQEDQVSNFEIRIMTPPSPSQAVVEGIHWKRSTFFCVVTFDSPPLPPPPPPQLSQPQSADPPPPFGPPSTRSDGS
jgi:hypothetical protein